MRRRVVLSFTDQERAYLASACEVHPTNWRKPTYLFKHALLHWARMIQRRSRPSRPRGKS